MKPNEQQILSFVRDLMQVIGTFLVTSHLWGMNDQTWQLVTGITLMLVPVIWGMVNHTQANTVATVAAMNTTEVKNTADGKIAIVLHDPVLETAATTNATPHKLK